MKKLGNVNKNMLKLWRRKLQNRNFVFDFLLYMSLILWHATFSFYTVVCVVQKVTQQTSNIMNHTDIDQGYLLWDRILPLHWNKNICLFSSYNFYFQEEILITLSVVETLRLIWYDIYLWLWLFFWWGKIY